MAFKPLSSAFTGKYFAYKKIDACIWTPSPTSCGPDVFQGGGSDLVPMEPGWEVCNPLPNAFGSGRSYEIWQNTTILDRWRLQWPCHGMPERMSLHRTDCAKISELFSSGTKSSLTGFISLGLRSR